MIPSLPGYGFSPAVGTRLGYGAGRQGLGHADEGARIRSYGAQGGDIGALVSKELGVLKPEGLVGVHLQQIFAFPSGADGEMEKLTPFELEGFANLDLFEKYNGYQNIQ